MENEMLIHTSKQAHLMQGRAIFLFSGVDGYGWEEPLLIYLRDTTSPSQSNHVSSVPLHNTLTP
jgi:hypothetical protein